MRLDTKRWSQVETLYHAVLEREPGTQEAFLAQACAGGKLRVRTAIAYWLTIREERGPAVEG